MKLRDYLYIYFSFNKQEKMGLSVLVFILIVTSVIPKFIYLLKAPPSISYEEYVNKNKTMYINDTINKKTSSFMPKGLVRKDYCKAKRKYLSHPIDINKADTSLLLMIKGIGSYYAKKIINFRTKLGGFYSIDQLKDLRFYSKSFKSMKKFLYVSPGMVKIFDLDTISFKMLLKHPYFDYNTVKRIFLLRREFRGLTPEFLLEKKAIDTLTYFKIRPYCIKK